MNEQPDSERPDSERPDSERPDSERHPAKSSAQPTSSEPSADRLLAYVMAAVAIWGGLLSLGSFLFGIDIAAGKPVFAPNPLRGLIVLATVTGFLGVWWAAWRARRKRV
jgi:hypothetical protein